MTKMKENCNRLKYVVIPKVYENVTQEYPNVILMEYIDGMKINRIQEADYEEFGKLVMKFGFVTTIIHGFAHGDLHCGNILFIKDEENVKCKYKIGIIDFGIMYEVEEEYKNSLFNILTQMFECTPRENALKIMYSGVIIPVNIVHKIPNSEFEKILQFTVEIIDETMNNSKHATQVQIYKFMSKLKEYMCNPDLAVIGIKPSDDFVKTQLVLAMAHGVTLTLCKDDFFSLADKVLNELFNVNLFLRE
jgi:predicted unusual protein kinase regulating ubiquinone biosynthesis (AarF/ABC1/UbiB family)